MPSKYRFIQLKSVKVKAVQSLKRRKIEASLVLNLIQLKINDNKLSITDINDIEGESGTQFQNENVNESDLDFEKKREGREEGRKKEYKNNESNPKTKKFKIKMAVSPKI